MPASMYQQQCLLVIIVVGTQEWILCASTQSMYILLGIGIVSRAADLYSNSMYLFIQLWQL